MDDTNESVAKQLKETRAELKSQIKQALLYLERLGEIKQKLSTKPSKKVLENLGNEIESMLEEQRERGFF